MQALHPGSQPLLCLWLQGLRLDPFAMAMLPSYHPSSPQALRLDPFAMGCSAAPRTELAPGVFTANEVT